MSEFENALPENWKSVLPEDMQANGVLATATTVESLAKMAIDGRNLANTALRIPSDDATPEIQSDFRKDLMTKMPDLMFKPNAENPDGYAEIAKTMGMPESAEGYTIGEMPDAIKENIGKIAALAHKANMTDDQFKAIADGIIGDYKASSDVNAGNVDIERGKLKEAWGDAFDKKVGLAEHFAKQVGFSDEFVSAIKDGTISSADMQALDKVIGGFEGEGVDIGRQPGNVDVTMTPAEAEERINDIMGNKGHAYWDASNPAHKAAVDKVVKLAEYAEAGKKGEGPMAAYG